MNLEILNSGNIEDICKYISSLKDRIEQVDAFNYVMDNIFDDNFTDIEYVTNNSDSEDVIMFKDFRKYLEKYGIIDVAQDAKGITNVEIEIQNEDIKNFIKGMGAECDVKINNDFAGENFSEELLKVIEFIKQGDIYALEFYVTNIDYTENPDLLGVFVALLIKLPHTKFIKDYHVEIERLEEIATMLVKLGQ